MQEHGAEKDNRYAIVVWGATGFTGRLVVEYLLRQYPEQSNLRWAIAGRSEPKLEALLSELSPEGKHSEPPEIIIADSHDAQSLQLLAASTRVVLSTVGPYARYGSELVAACVRTGTHYCDLCGEVQWMRRMIDTHQAAAASSGARIVMSCGFDSIPSDFGAWFLQRQAQALHGEKCIKLTLLVKAMKGGASGGTFASMLNAVDEARRDRDVARILTDPYALNPADERHGPDGRDQTGAVYHAAADTWTAPFVMASVNTRVVRRSNALSNGACGKDVRYRYNEAVVTGAGFSGRIKAMLISVALRLFLSASAIPFTRRWVVQKLVPRPGEGPSRQERESGFFNLLVVGELADGRSIRLRIKGDRDPGYGSTSKMLAESAVCLALDPLDVGGGCWTPATAMGESLFRRLTENAGLSFTLES